MHILGASITVLSLVFLFWGEPDVWDALRAKAMDSLVECPKPPAKQTKRGLAF